MMNDNDYLYQALSLAKMRKGFCAPNPSVGAVVVKNGKILSTGYHIAAGYPHAEVEALKPLGKKAQGATLYVTLEPCSHWGRTPPCVEAILESGVKKVFYAYQDPNPQVAGKGAQRLLDSGILCQQISLVEIDQFYQSYGWWCKTKLPFVTAKLAISLDGKIAGPHGEPQQLTGKELQTFTHQYRQQADAILTSVQTILKDNPALNVRLTDPPIGKALYIIDRQLRMPTSAQIIKTAKNITLFYDPVFMNNHLIELQELAIQCQPISALGDIMHFIGEQGVHDLWVEAGGRLFTALLEAKLVQKVLIYVAPKVLGIDAINAFPTSQNLFAQARSIQWQIVGEDVCCNVFL